MKAFLTFIRKKEDDIHMLGLENPSNIFDLLFLDLKSGQPIISVIHNQKIIAFYIINSQGNIYQLLGEKDYLFELNELHDLSLINLQKYNIIQHYVSQVFDCLSIQEAKCNYEIFELLEEKIFYNLLHTEIEVYKIKLLIAKEIKKSDIAENLLLRLLAKLKITKTPNKKILKKKIDVDLSGYGIKINTLIQ